METSSSSSSLPLLTTLLLAAFLTLTSVGLRRVHGGSIGFCYGRNGDNLPSPQSVAQFLAKQSIGKVRIYDYNTSVITAFAGTSIDLVITIPNEELPNFQTEELADAWVNSVLSPLVALSGFTISVVTVGVEVPNLTPHLAPFVLPAMLNIHTGLTKANLANEIKVSTAHSMAILQTSFPPSSAAFNASLAASFVKPILDFLKQTGSFYMANAYPYHAYMFEQDSVALDYALFQPKKSVVDPNTNLSYTGMLFAQLDAVYFALESMGHSELNVVVSETGWPTKGDSDETAATVQNAAAYNNHLMELVNNETGTPYRPGHPLQAFIFSVFDEDKKPGKSSERNWGVFDVNEDSFYYLDVNNSESGSPQSFNGTGGTWCVAIPSASNESLEEGLNYACGQGNADCAPIQQGQACFSPDTFVNHASYAYNSYYQRSGDNSAACNFGGTAMITTSNPSYGSCVFETDAGTSTTNGTFGASFSPSSSPWTSLPSVWFTFSLVLFCIL